MPRKIVIYVKLSLIYSRLCQFVQACLRAPPVVADEAKLASPFFFLLRLLLFTHFEESSVRENLFLPIFWNK